MVFTETPPKGPAIACPPPSPTGYLAKEVYNSREVQLRFRGEGEFNRCLNQKYPEMNNHRQNWGVDYGDAPYKCGDVTVKAYLGNPAPLEGMSSAGFVPFVDCGYDCGDIGEESKNYCKGKNCFEERAVTRNYKHKGSGKIIEYKQFFRRVFEECSKTTF